MVTHDGISERLEFFADCGVYCPAEFGGVMFIESKKRAAIGGNEF
jgi:hypothetical protein